MFERTEDGYRSSLLAELGVPHLFTTRPLDVGPLEVDGPELSRRLRASAGMSAATTLFAARQVHGSTVVRVDHLKERLAIGDLPADGLWSTDPEAAVLVRTADCVPVLVASEDGSRVAAMHAGWRGLAAGVITNTLVAAGKLAGVPHANFVAAIGPCLSPERFEVGPEVADAFRRADLGEAIHEPSSSGAGSKPHIDLRAAAATQLERAGVARLDVADLCTWEQSEDFWSYRRDVTHGGVETTGRLAALIAPRAS